MIYQLGPSFQQVFGVERDDFFYFGDSFDQQHLYRAIEQFGSPQAIITDVEGTEQDLGILNYSVPVFLKYSLGILIDDVSSSIEQHFPLGEITNQHCFNFMVIKKRLERYLLLKMISWYELDDYRYTCSDQFDNFNFSRWLPNLDKYDESFKRHLLAPQTAIKPFHQNLQAPGMNSWPYIWSQVRHVYESVAVSLVTESSSNGEPNFVFTEKSLWAFLGLTFPIWVGNKGQARQAQRMGFDIFDDVIDHGYQDQSCVIERCRMAIEHNLELLTDLDLVTNLRSKHHARLMHNRQHILEGGLSAWVEKQLNSLPDSIRQSLTEYQEQMFCRVGR
jgi:hypothetical protein